MPYLVPKKYSRSFYSYNDYNTIETMLLIFNRNKNNKNKHKLCSSKENTNFQYFLPPELYDIIIFRHLVDIKVKVGEHYIIRKLINSVYKEQIVKMDAIYKYNNKYLFNYHYGIFGYHEGTCTIKNILELTPEQEKKKYWELPQQFYQSVPMP